MNRHDTPEPPAGIAAFAADLASRAARTRVICLGLSALDLIWNVDTFFSGGSQKIRSSDYVSAGGGMAANAAVAPHPLGVCSATVAAVRQPSVLYAYVASPACSCSTSGVKR